MENTAQNSTPESHICPIRPWPIPSADRSPKDISQYIALVNRSYPGGFRALNVDKIKKAVEAGTEDEDSKMAEGDEGDGEDDDDDASAAKDPIEARNETLHNIASAHNSALFALDMISLLLTKETPVQAGLTLRQDLRDLVGIGTLGSQKHAESNVTREKIKDFADITAGWNILAIDEAKDSAHNAATLLEKEVDKEAKYWDDLLTVSESGWSVCRLPKERNTLGVKFGFNEATSEFKKYNFAPMRRAADGSLELDLGILGGQAQRLVVTVEKDGKVTGTSTLDAPAPDGEKPLSARVLEARNTVFSRELWHELQMEARSLLSYDVKVYESSIVYTTRHGAKIRLELLSLDACPEKDETLADNSLATAVHVALHILLGHAHRQNETLRSRPLPPNQPRGRSQNQYHLLRPVIARLIYRDAIEECTQYIGNLVKSLRNAKIPEAKFELVTAPHALADMSSVSNDRARSHLSQALLSNITTPLFFAIDLTITPGNRVSIIARTWLLPATTTIYQISLPPSNPEQPNTLAETCPPHRDYPNLAELRCYLDQAVACAITSAFQPRLEEAERARQLEKTGGSLEKADGYDAEQDAFWVKSVAGTSLSTSAGQAREISFRIAGTAEDPRIEATSIVRADGDNVSKNMWNAAGAGDDGNGLGLLDVCESLVRQGYD